MDPQVEALEFLRWVAASSNAGLPETADPALEVILPQNWSSEQRELIEKIIEKLPFRVGELRRVSVASQFLCLDFSGQSLEASILYSKPIAEIAHSPEEKKKLWLRLQDFAQGKVFQAETLGKTL
jgi:hypothetical protein